MCTQTIPRTHRKKQNIPRHIMTFKTEDQGKVSHGPTSDEGKVGIRISAHVSPEARKNERLEWGSERFIVPGGNATQNFKLRGIAHVTKCKENKELETFMTSEEQEDLQQADYVVRKTYRQ